MNLAWILAGTLVAGIGSVWLAALLSFGVMARLTRHMLSFAAGALLATALLKLLPEAVETGISVHVLFGVLLAGVVFFFVLDKAELYHHGHEHGDHGLDLHSDEPVQHSHLNNHSHTHSHNHQHIPHSGGWAVLAGDSVHAFGDGVLIASAFMADWRLGVIASMAVLAHEVPHHMGDLVVLQHSEQGNTTGGGSSLNDHMKERDGEKSSAKAALLKVSMAGTVTALGGIAGYFLLAQFAHTLPFVLVVAASSFIYVALADLIPQLQRHVSLRDSMGQLLWLGAGIALVMVVGELSHHAH